MNLCRNYYLTRTMLLELYLFFGIVRERLFSTE